MCRTDEQPFFEGLGALASVVGLVHLWHGDRVMVGMCLVGTFVISLLLAVSCYDRQRKALDEKYGSPK